MSVVCGRLGFMKRKKIENKPYIEAMREIRRSNKAGTHQDKREKRSRTRQAKLDKALREENENGSD
jgi:hypothetical protein